MVTSHLIRSCLFYLCLVMNVASYGAAFSDVQVGLPNLMLPGGAWGDYDNDGDLDLLLYGSDGSTFQLDLWRNDQGAFSKVTAGLPSVPGVLATWGDYDNDGYLDLALFVGNYATYEYSVQVWRGNGTAFNQQYSTPAMTPPGGLKWIDLDRDGDLDLVWADYGASGFTDVIHILRNEGGSFTHSTPGFHAYAFAFGDYNGDGFPDLLASFYTGSTPSVVKLRRPVCRFRD